MTENSDIKIEKVKKKRLSFYQKFVKRFLDVTISFFALVILSPLFLIIAILIKCSMGGKVIFAQYRPGKGCKTFKMYKFKTMTDERDDLGKIKPDKSRITKLGRFLRKTGLDELPQLYNILRGDMSIIGPRPRLVKDIIFYSMENREIYSVRPGLSGPSQVEGGRSTSAWDFIFQTDLRYAKNVTFKKDISIFFKTIKVLLKNKDSMASTGESNRDYYYSDFLLRSGQISKQQYQEGLDKANQMTSTSAVIGYQEELHTDLSKHNSESNAMTQLTQEKGEPSNDKN